MDRRTYLAGCSLAASTALGGCLDALAGRAEPGSTETPLYPDDRDVPSSAGTHDLFVENFDDTRYTGTVTVVRVSDDTLVWEGTYDVPDERGFVVPDVLVTGRRYEVTVDLADGKRSTVDQSVDPCPGEGGSRNLGVRIRDGEVSYHRDDCDEIRVGVELNYGDHEQFLVEETP